MEDTIFNLIEIMLKSLGIQQNPVVFLSLFGLIMARLVPAINYTPFFGGGAINSRVKIGLAFSLAFLLYPAMASAVPIEVVPTHFLPFLLLMLKETVLGYTIGYVTSLIFYGIQTAGQMVDNMRGATIAQLQNLQLSTQTSLVGQFKLQTAIVLFFSIDGHLLYIRGLFYSFEKIPVNVYPHISTIVTNNELTPVITDLIKLSGDVLIVGLQLASPVLVCLFLTDVVFGIFNRVAPQINVFFLSLPVKMLLACAMLFMLWGAIIAQMEERFTIYLKALYTLIARAVS